MYADLIHKGLLNLFFIYNYYTYNFSLYDISVEPELLIYKRCTILKSRSLFPEHSTDIHASQPVPCYLRSSTDRKYDNNPNVTPIRK